MMLELIDNYGASLVIYVMAIVETASISYIYGLSNICHDFEVCPCLKIIFKCQLFPF